MMNQPDLDLGGDDMEPNRLHGIRPLIMDGLIAEIGEMAWAIYCVIQVHADLHTGRTYINQARIASLVGVTSESVNTAAKKLIAAGLITANKRGRNKEYQLPEHAYPQSEASQPLAVRVSPAWEDLSELVKTQKRLRAHAIETATKQLAYRQS